MNSIDELIKVWRWRGVDWPSPDFRQAADELAALHGSEAGPQEAREALTLSCANDCHVWSHGTHAQTPDPGAPCDCQQQHWGAPPAR